MNFISRCHTKTNKILRFKNRDNTYVIGYLTIMIHTLHPNESEKFGENEITDGLAYNPKN